MARIAQRILRFLFLPATRYVLSWFLLLLMAAAFAGMGWIAFNDLRRPGRNSGHTTIDFGGQWLMGRMVASGLGQHLYDRNSQRQVLREAYPREDEVPQADRTDEEKGEHDVEKLMGWLMGRDASSDQANVGGPLYPPIQALFMCPLGYLQPALAYRLVQGMTLLAGFLAGWGICQLSHGRIWYPIAVALVMLFPGFSHGLNLGQNSAFMLVLLVWGWVFIARGDQIVGGILWGLLAFKPVWPAAFFLVPLLTGRWRVCLAMIATGAGLAAATLPVVGLHSWLDWLEIGREAAFYYGVDENWVSLSRDLLNVPRRWLVDFQLPAVERQSLAATIVGWGLLLGVCASTIILTLLRKDRGRAIKGAPATFLLLGAFLSCYHFMYYDVLLAALPILLLFTEPRRYLEPRLITVTSLGSAAVDASLKEFYRPRLPGVCPESISLPSRLHRNIYLLNSLALSLLVFLLATESLLPLLDLKVSVWFGALDRLHIPVPLKYTTALTGTPWSTLCLLVFWLWTGWLWLRAPADVKETEKSNELESLLPAPETLVNTAQLV